MRIGLLLLAIAATPAAAQDALDIGGRWMEIHMAGGEQFKAGAIEFAPCGDNMCGVRIEAGGKCGAVFVEMRRAEARNYSGSLYPHYTGASEWNGRKLDFYVWRQGDKIRMTASEGRSPFSRVLPVKMLENDFRRTGEASCKTPVS